MIFKKNIFIHIPKTGGNSLTHLIAKFSEDKIIKHLAYSDKINTFDVKGSFTRSKHQTIEQYKTILKNDFNKYYKFSIIRNPLDRLISFYYQQDNNLKVNYFINKINNIFFKIFKIAIFDYKFYKYKKPRFSKKKFENFIKSVPNQFHYLKIKNKLDKSINLIRYENYDKELKLIFKKLNIKYDYIKINQSRKKKFTTKQLKELEKIVLNTHHNQDYKVFNFKKLKKYCCRYWSL